MSQQTELARPMPTKEQALFVAKIEKTASCWEWIAGKYQSGYGAFNLSRPNQRRSVYAHRYSYEMFVGPIPEGLQIDHLCRNRSCVNPNHLEPVTRAENLRRGVAAITHCPAGHEYTPDNVYIDAGTRKCKRCVRARVSARWNRKMQDPAFREAERLRSIKRRQRTAG